MQALEDEQWALAAAEAEKSGYVGTEASLKLLPRGLEEADKKLAQENKCSGNKSGSSVV